jgi:hypothetical protein
MSVLNLWRAASTWKRAFSVIGISAAVFLLSFALLRADRAHLLPGLVPGGALAILSIALLLEGYRLPKRSRPGPSPHTTPPRTQANAAVMPVPAAPPRDAVARPSA